MRTCGQECMHTHMKKISLPSSILGFLSTTIVTILKSEHKTVVRLCGYIVVYYEQSMMIIALFWGHLAIYSPSLERAARKVLLFSSGEGWQMRQPSQSQCAWAHPGLEPGKPKTRDHPETPSRAASWRWPATPVKGIHPSRPCPRKLVCALGTCALAEAVKQVVWAVEGRSQFSW